MAAYIPAANALMLCFDFVSNGQQWQFCLGFRKLAGSIVSQDLIDASVLGAGWFGASLQSHVGTNVTLTQVRARDLTVQEGEEAVAASGLVGTNIGTHEPQGSTAVLSWRTHLRGRSFRGRTYISGANTSMIASSVAWTPTWVNDLAIAFQALQSQMSAIGFIQVVISRYSNGVARPTALMTTIDTIITDTTINSQRRRLLGRGT